MKDFATSQTAHQFAADPRHTQLLRVLRSPQFSSAPLLRAFLEFITIETIEGRTEEINEYAIATRVFGRPDDFDPTYATIVRTQAYRLRKKLQDYYASDGSRDPLLIEIPKGHYVPTFAERTIREAPATPWKTWALWTIAGILVSFVLGWVGRGAGNAALKSDLPEAVRQFWLPFRSSGRPVIVGYTNPVYWVTDRGDLVRPDPGPLGTRGEPVPEARVDRKHGNPLLRSFRGPLHFEDGFTGAGEVLAVTNIARVLERMGVPAIIKRSRMVTLDDLRNHDVVFVGSGSSAQALEGLELHQRFLFVRPASPPYLWRNRIVDSQDPSRAFETGRHPDTKTLVTDYATIGLHPGIDRDHKVLVFAGLSTSGTQGAAECAISERCVEKLLTALGRPAKGPSFFEAVIRVDTAKGLDAMKPAVVTAQPLMPDR